MEYVIWLNKISIVKNRKYVKINEIVVWITSEIDYKLFPVKLTTLE